MPDLVQKPTCSRWTGRAAGSWRGVGFGDDGVPIERVVREDGRFCKFQSEKNPDDHRETHLPVGALHERMIEDMRVRGIGEKTQKYYVRRVGCRHRGAVARSSRSFLHAISTSPPSMATLTAPKVAKRRRREEET